MATETPSRPHLPFPRRCQVQPETLRGIEQQCPMPVQFHHEILLEGDIYARSASCSAHLFEAAAGLFKAIIAAAIDVQRVRSISVTQAVLTSETRGQPVRSPAPAPDGGTE